jgi:hypothetical protein
LQRKTGESNPEQALQKLPFGASFKKRLPRGTRAMPPRTLRTSPPTGPSPAFEGNSSLGVRPSLTGMTSFLRDHPRQDIVSLRFDRPEVAVVEVLASVTGIPKPQPGTSSAADKAFASRGALATGRDSAPACPPSRTFREYREDETPWSLANHSERQLPAAAGFTGTAKRRQ